MKSVYRVLAYLVAVGVLLQAANIGFAWFSAISELDQGAIIDANYEGNTGHMLHGVVGMMGIPVVALLLFIVAFFAKVAGGVKWAGIVLVVALVQVGLAFLSFGIPAVGALHGINALVLFAVAHMAGHRMTAAPAEHAHSSVGATV